MLYIRMLLLLAVILGWSLFLRTKWKIKMEFAPSIVCASISTVMFFAGILNVFRPAVIIITVSGLFTFLYLAVTYYKEFPGMKREMAICGIWLAAVVYFAVLVRGAHFIHYDNFSHWAVVIRSMLQTDRMPNFQDPLIIFQSYPLGSGVFIYYVCKVIGDTDACYIFGQLLMMLSFLLPLTAFVKKKNLIAGIGVLIFAVTALTCNILIYDLLVDTLMPLAGLALFCMIEDGADSDLDKLTDAALPICVFLVQVKNSGIFFCVIAWIYLYHKFRKEFKGLSGRAFRLKFCGLDLAVPLLSVYFWKRHVLLVYSGGDTSKHAMSLKNFSKVSGEKTSEDIAGIVSGIFGKLTDVHNVSFIIMAVITAMFLLLAVYFLVNKEGGKLLAVCKELGFLYLIFALYVLSVFGMYVFSMPTGEAVSLAGYDRYMMTIDIFCLGLALVYAVRACMGASKAFPSAAMVLCLACTLIPFRGNMASLVKRQDYESTTRAVIQRVIGNFRVGGGKNYLIYHPNADGYMYFIARYELCSEYVTLATADNFADYLADTSSYDYVIVLVPDAYSQSCLRDAGMEKYANGQACVISEFTE